ncbi:hypothetical protein [Roseobacter sp. GAI101]|uniref:hypothetical protein n=1 Tax=Roseobacter sp. (strain GAI101) TaxID=391589 RepID=UPI0020C75F38|nr:hypothetical protein [Roseobacter sp. GAI101]
MTKPDTDMLESLFQDARAAPPQMPAGLMERVMADALALQSSPPARGWRGLWQAIGGAPALGGLITATAVGFWIGVAPPSGLPEIAAQIITGDTYATIGDDSVNALTAFGWDIEEG